MRLNYFYLILSLYLDLHHYSNFRDKVRTGSASSGDFSEYDEGGGEFGGTGVKINEWQAAWNVTNAIQVL